MTGIWMGKDGLMDGRNPVAKHSKVNRAATHKDRKRASKAGEKPKHRNLRNYQ